MIYRCKGNFRQHLLTSNKRNIRQQKDTARYQNILRRTLGVGKCGVAGKMPRGSNLILGRLKSPSLDVFKKHVDMALQDVVY